MKVELIRSDSKGIAGTRANMECHAKKCAPFVEALVPLVSTLDFKSWKQGHNVHVFITHDDRKYDIVPYAHEIVNNETHYIGLQFRIRLSRSSAISLMTVTSMDDVVDLYNMMKVLTRVMPENKAAKFQHQKA